MAEIFPWYDPERFRYGTHRQRMLQILRVFPVVPLPYFLRMEPRIAWHTSVISMLRKKGFVINNFEIPSQWPNGNESHSFYELLVDPENNTERESQEEEFTKNYRWKYA